MNNRDAIQFSSDSIFLLLKAKIVLIKEYNIILFVLILAQNLIYTVWGTGLGYQGGQISNINRSENHKSTVDPGTTLALITNQMLLFVQVKYKNFQLRVIRDTGLSTEHAKVREVVFKSGFEYIPVLKSDGRSIERKQNS